MKAVYVIVCSRGPGSETIVSEEIDVVKQQDGSYLWTELLDDPDEDPSFNKLQIDEIYNGVPVAWYDEGPILFVSDDMSDSTVLGALLKCFEDDGEGFLDLIDNLVERDSSLDKLLREMQKAKLENVGAFTSAIIRSYLQRSVWTSCDAWRNLEIEIMSKEQVDRYMEFTGTTIEVMLASDCKVLKECAGLYPDNLPKENARGC